MSDFLVEEGSETGGHKIIDLGRLRADIRKYYLLFFVFLVMFVAAALGVIMLMAPVYTATALVGPADNSDDPFGAGASALAGGVGGLAKHLHVGSMLGQGGSDPFNEYVSLLTSTRLASVLVTRDHILPIVFADEWDAANKRWYPRSGFVDQVIDSAKRLLGRPVKAAPDVDDLAKFFDTNLNVDLSLETNFATATLKFRDPAEAERLLDLILLEADNIIRQDKRRDVSARIAYLNDALEHLTLADQKPAMIDVLSQQQQEMMMIASDHRYASILIDSPHAPLKPTSPVPTVDAAIAFALACFSWFGAVRLTPRSGRLRRILEAFARPRRRHHDVKAGMAAQAGTHASG